MIDQVCILIEYFSELCYLNISVQCRITARNKTSFAIKPLDSKPVNDSLIKANPNIPMDVISVGAESNP